MLFTTGNKKLKQPLTAKTERKKNHTQNEG